MALVATRDVLGEEIIVAVARYLVITPERPELAEIAFVVEDPYQGQGLGTFLCDRLKAYALAHGIKAFHADVHGTNTRMLHLIRQIGPVTSRRLDAGVVEITVDLERKEPPLGDSESE
jgi:RimJ/RimL family protein N-acetyltransferase